MGGGEDARIRLFFTKKKTGLKYQIFTNIPYYTHILFSISRWSDLALKGRLDKPSNKYERTHIIHIFFGGLYIILFFLYSVEV